MDSTFSSLETIVSCSGAILTSAVFLWGLWKTYGFVGYPIGKMIVRFTDQEGENNESFRAAKFGAVLGGFLCYGLIAWKTTSQSNLQRHSLPGEQPYGLALFIAKFILQACGEAAAVLAILSGVVKVLRLDVRKEGPVSREKDESRIA